MARGTNTTPMNANRVMRTAVQRTQGLRGPNSVFIKRRYDCQRTLVIRIAATTTRAGDSVMNIARFRPYNVLLYSTIILSILNKDFLIRYLMVQCSQRKIERHRDRQTERQRERERDRERDREKEKERESHVLIIPPFSGETLLKSLWFWLLTLIWG